MISDMIMRSIETSQAPQPKKSVTRISVASLVDYEFKPATESITLNADGSLAPAQEGIVSWFNGTKLPGAFIHPQDQNAPKFDNAQDAAKYLQSESKGDADLIVKGYLITMRDKSDDPAGDINTAFKLLPEAFANAREKAVKSKRAWEIDISHNDLLKSLLCEAIEIRSNPRHFEYFFTLPEEFGGHGITVVAKPDGNKYRFITNLVG